VRRDDDNSKYKTFTNVPSSTRHVDSFNRTANIDPKPIHPTTAPSP